jgi:hypothetical protein
MDADPLTAAVVLYAFRFIQLENISPVCPDPIIKKRRNLFDIRYLKMWDVAVKN